MKNGLTLILPVLALAACSSEPSAPLAQTRSEAASDAADARSAEALSRPTPAPPAAIGSHYTSLKTCREVERVEEGSYGRSLCDAPGGLVLEYVTFDGRDDLRIGNSAKGAINLEFPSLGKGAFNSLGPAIEWRGAAGPGGFMADALIVRNAIYDTPETPDRARSTLAVVDLSKRCVVAQIPPGPGQNEAARAEAGKKGGTCVSLQ